MNCRSRSSSPNVIKADYRINVKRVIFMTLYELQDNRYAKVV